MQLYASRASRRTWQIAADLAAIATIVAAVWLANLVREAIASLAGFGVQMQDAGSTFAETLEGAGEALAEVPLVGGSISEPFTTASGAAEGLADGGRQLQDAVHAIASSVSTAVWLLPVLLLVLIWLLPRVRFVLKARDTTRVLAHPAGRDVLALRAVARLPFADVVRAVPDPLAALRDGDAPAIDALARLELRAQGVRAPRATSPSGGAAAR